MKLSKLVFQYLKGSIKRRISKEVAFELSKKFLLEFPIAETARSVIQDQRFSLTLTPQSRELPDANNILVYAPHQDDETLGAGGVLLRSVERGKQVKTIYLTDGAAGTKETNDHRHALIRKKEAQAVWNRIGGEEPEFWDFACRNIPLHKDHAVKMIRAIERHNADCIFLPFLLEKPDDHRKTNQLFSMAHRISKFPSTLTIWSYQVTSMMFPNVVVDITELMDRKHAVNKLWRSQNTAYNWAHFSKGLAAYNSIFLNKEITPCPKRLYAEIYYVAPAPEYAALVEHFFGETHV